MAYEVGDIKVFNPNKDISREIILEVVTRHRDSLKQARTGELVGVSVEQIKDNDRKMNQVRALSLIISAQREMINISRPVIYFRSMQNWKKKYKEEEEQKTNPFDKFECDYKNLIEWREFLKYCEESILEAEKSASLEDDFLIEKIGKDGETVLELTGNFREMLDELEDSFEQIYLLMLTNKIVSAGIEEDEEMTYKEKEQEAIRRVVEA